MRDLRDKAITLLIYNKTFDENYTAHIQQNGTGWERWMTDLPEIEWAEETLEGVQEKLSKMLHQTLVAAEEAWEKQIERDMEAGRLDDFIKEADEDYKAGRCTKVVT